MSRKRCRKPATLDKAEGHAIEQLPGIARIDAIALEMFGPPGKPKSPIIFGFKVDALNHNARIAALIGVSDRRMRQIRATGQIHQNLLDRLTLEWKIWRRRESDRKKQARLARRKAAKAARLRAIQERGIDAVHFPRR